MASKASFLLYASYPFENLLVVPDAPKDLIIPLGGETWLPRRDFEIIE